MRASARTRPLKANLAAMKRHYVRRNVEQVDIALANLMAWHNDRGRSGKLS